MKKLTVGIIGAGRIGKLHAENLRYFPDVHVKTISDIFIDNVKDWAKDIGIQNVVQNYEEILQDESIDAVLICSPTTTHSEIIYKAVENGKHIFCEKPITFDLEESLRVLETVEQSNIKFQVGFNRRFDKNFATVQKKVQAGEIGDIHIIKITARDPKPPTPEYIKNSGGLFIDMSIHDFDMLRFLAQSNITEVYVNGANLVDPVFQKYDDLDTAIINVRFESGAIGVIDNSREAVYGYDQRVEVFGSKGVIQAENVLETTVKKSTIDGTSIENPKYFFLERYRESYVNELIAFFDSIQNNTNTLCTVQDGVEAERIAHSAKKSWKTGRVVQIQRSSSILS
jgi:myo-inositol 2-dehydrogenase / D-chiro-inositol 1-dehydrogenase